jgi:GrpB-like predicted nucleotidyltransferase (UPF0157 family)
MTHRAEIVLVPYSSAWPILFEEERRRLLQIFFGERVKIEHVGSTSVPGLGAKPIIDILLGAENLSVIEAKIERLEAAGYEYRPEHEVTLPERRFFAKPKKRPRTFHVHAVQIGGRFWADHIWFRDALRRSPGLARRYFELKTELARRYVHDRESYTEAKGPFIRSVLEGDQEAEHDGAVL